MIRSVLVGLLWVCLVIFLGVASWMIVLYLEWPIWSALAIFLGVFGIYFGLKAIRRFVIRSRVKLRLTQSEGQIASASLSKTNYQQLLLAKWKAAIALLNRSQLRKFGNPLYVLPWFMVMGESGAGKTTAITRSRLTPMLRDQAQIKQIVQTANCDWWFFSEAVVLDTAGRYVSPSGDTLDHDEWNYLLQLFGKYRSREGLNGLVITIDAPTLLAGESESIENLGRSLRDRIDQLMRLFERRIPIYVMITKCDQIYGFAQWADKLTNEQSQEAMGFLSDQASDIGDEQLFAAQALKTLMERLGRLRLDFAMRGETLSPEMLLLPEEITRLQRGLQIFLKAALGQNPYLEHPFLRGLFLTSGRQESPLPSRLGALLMSAPSTQESDRSSKGLFIHDIFSRILPKERGIALPGQIVSRWRRVTENMLLVSWISLCVAILIFIFLSYQSTDNTIERFAKAIPDNFGQVASSNISIHEEIEQLNNGLMVVNLILKEEGHWNTRWLAFNPEVVALESKLKQVYVAKFREVQDSSSGVNFDLKHLLSTNDPILRAHTLLALARYVNMLQARIDGASYKQLLAMPQMPQEVIARTDPELIKRLSTQIDALLVASIAWSSPDDPYLAQILLRFRELLLAEVFKSPQMEWLVQWANLMPGVTPITLGNFWNPDVVSRSGPEIDGGLTLRGKQRIDMFMNELRQALQNRDEVTKASKAFYSWYLDERLNAWRGFAWGLMQGENLITTEPDFRQVIASLGTINSPFILFLNKIKDEFDTLPSTQSPSWLEFARYYLKLFDQVRSTSPLRGAMSTVSAVNNVAGQALRDSVEQRTNLISGQVSKARDDMAFVEQFLNGLRETSVEVLLSTKSSFDMTEQYFSKSTTTEKANALLSGIERDFKSFKANSKFNSPDDAVIWNVLEGSIDTIRLYAFEQASCKLQQDWEKSVMWKTQLAINPQEASAQLFGDQGSVWGFVDGPAKNFVTRNAGFISPVEVSGKQFPFAPGFIAFLNQAVSSRVNEVVKEKLAQTSLTKGAKISLAALPIGVNQGAKARPFSATLSIQCTQETIELSNLNFQASNTFEWKPDQCGEVILDIQVDNLTLTKRYPGALGLSIFLEEFKDGARIFTPVDFPASMERLDELGIREISLRYDMQGRDEVLKLARDYELILDQSTPSNRPVLSRLNIEVPARVGRCWTAQTPSPAPLTLPRFIQQQAQIKANPPPVPTPEPVSPPRRLEEGPVKTITVAAGETLSSIGKRYRVDSLTLQVLNKLKTDKILTGQKLLVPMWSESDK